MNNKKLGFLFLALAIVACILYFVTHSTFYLVGIGVNICAAIALFLNNRISGIFILIASAGMIYSLVAMIRAILFA